MIEARMIISINFISQILQIHCQFKQWIYKQSLLLFNMQHSYTHQDIINCILMNYQKYKVVSNYTYSPSDVLGTGTWGTVYKAKLRDSEDEQQFAIKKMNKFKVQASQKSFAKYQSQVLTLQKAGDIPQVIKIIDFFKSKSHYYIVTEYFSESKDLYQYMIQHKQKFCQEQARRIWKDLLIGLQALHSMGIYHRDLKLQNVVYLPLQRRAKIIDFGMATCFPNPEGVVGSPMFMSPQVLSNQKYTHKCDIWSLGIIFYCMIFRGSPYEDNTTQKQILEKMKIMKQSGISYPQNLYASKPCLQVIEACLQYEQKDRMEIQGILQLKFFQQLEIPAKALEYYEPSTSFRT